MKLQDCGDGRYLFLGVEGGQKTEDSFADEFQEDNFAMERE